MSSKVDELLQKELDQAHAGTHQRQKGEEKRLTALKATRVRRAEQLRQLRIEQIDQQFDAVRREAEDEFNREKSTLQDRLYQEVVERQRRTSSKAEDMNSIRAMTRRYRQTRGDAAAAAKPINKREIKGTTTAVPLRQGEVEEDFETMTVLAEHINPTMEASFMEIEVRARDRLRPVDAVLPKRPLDGAGGKRQRRGDFDFKGKARAEVSGARITVWYEEEHGGRKMDVPYVGVVNSCDPREGLYVKFEGFPEEMLITNEDDWQWGSHSRKPPARAPR